MPTPTSTMPTAYYNPNQSGTLPSTAEENGVGALALTDCAVAAVEDALRDIVSEAVTRNSFVSESRSRASSAATNDEDSEESEDEDCEEELHKRRIDEHNQRYQGRREAEDDESPVDYHNRVSVNKFYPQRKGKSPKVIPIGPLKILNTDAEKHSFCLKWRNCTTEAEQKALKERCVVDANAKKRAAKEAKARDQRMKKKQEEEAKTERKRKRKEESDEKKRERDLRRNANKRKRTADKNAAKEQENIVSIGVICSALLCSIILLI